MEELRPTHEELLRRCEAAEATLAAIRSGKTNGKQGERETWVLRTTELEQRSEHIKNVLLAIRNVNQIIVAETDRQQLIEKVCAVLTETMGYFQAWVALLGGDGKTVSMTAFSGFDGGFQEMRQLLERGQYPDCLSRAIASATTIVIQNPEIQCPECPLVSQYGGRSGLAHRLAFDSKVYGVLAVSVPAAYAYDEEEQKFFEELANDLAFALQRMEIIQARRDAEEQYRLALFGGDLGTWDWNIQTGEVIFNTRWAEMLGYELHEIEPHIRSWEKLVHPDDMPDVMQALNAHLEGKTDTYEIEHRLLHKSGEWVWVLDKGRVF
ncbi:MAG TPA: PAS domain-containing protein, partial [bacterium]|nr:PAS domain-containing protein [bacterium]